MFKHLTRNFTSYTHVVLNSAWLLHIFIVSNARFNFGEMNNLDWENEVLKIIEFVPKFVFCMFFKNYYLIHFNYSYEKRAW